MALDFYPRSPCGERHIAQHPRHLRRAFLSTLSLRRATAQKRYHGSPAAGISIHALLAESDLSMAALRQALSAISIHALLAESDAYGRINDISRLIFLSTLSLRRATAGPDRQRAGPGISIHALLAESDSQCRTLASGIYDFYPRSPCGERPYKQIGV